ncbi:hypothetical protein HF086_014381 [Spodoptera exigua]|uniref:Uncharacterized protein n=1 Tax=Spodoptera exigua TaxID=7107 RepID=A0A922SC59_SPOEX|nr:hypothetical protein HF086_014381 [Spodoptera exigua]
MPRTTRSAQRSARSSDDDDTVVESRTHAGAAHTHVACDGDAPRRAPREVPLKNPTTCSTEAAAEHPLTPL